MSDGVDTPPSGATHQLGELARGEWHEVPAVELRKGGDNTGARRHMDAEREGFSGEDDLDQPALKQVLHQLLQVGQQPGVMHREAAAQRIGVQEVDVQFGLVPVLDLLQALLHQLIDRGLLGWRRQVEPVGGTARQGLATAPSRKDEIDRRQEFPPREAVDHR